VAIATPEGVGLALAVPALAVGARVLAGREAARGSGAETRGRGGAEAAETRGASERGGRGGWRTPLVRAGVATALGVAIVGAERFGGAAAAGMVAGFPAMSLTLALLIHRACGARAATQTLGGLVRGLAGYFAFAATAALLAPSPLAVPAGLAACAVMASRRSRAPGGRRRGRPRRVRR
jgi:hypothetical protein